jgi:hypothetical protein
VEVATLGWYPHSISGRYHGCVFQFEFNRMYFTFYSICIDVFTDGNDWSANQRGGLGR